MKPAAIFALLLAGTAAFADPALPPKADAKPDDKGVVEHARLEVQPGGRAIKQLTVENPLGNIKIEGYDGKSILIETTKQAPDEEALERLRVSLIPNPDGTVRIMTTADGGKEVKPLARGAVKIDLVIHAPRDARIDAASSSGSLEVLNMDAGGELDTGTGTISVRNVAGELETHSLSGATSLTQVFGTVDAQAIAADVDLDTVGGPRLVANVNKGTIAGRRVRSRDVELTTTEGRISLEAELPMRGHLVVSSLRGDIDVKVHRRAGISVRARGAKLDLGATIPSARPEPDGWVKGQIGEVQAAAQASLVEMRSSYGLVRFAVVQ